MAITASELIIRRAETNNDTPSANGGKMGTTVVTSGATNNVFPNTSQAERTAGITRYRKIFLKNHSAEDLALTSTKIFMDNITPAADAVNFYEGDYVDTEDGITGTDLYGCGDLAVTVSSSDTSVAVTLEDDESGTPVVIFRAGDVIRITDKATANAVTGNEEYATIDTLGSLVGSVQTINLTSGLANGYNSSNSRVMSVYEPGDLNGAMGSWVPTTTSGTYDSNEISTGIRGAIGESWSFVFTSSTAFDLYADGVPTGLSGNTSTIFSPTNPDTSTAYFTVNVAFWSGTWATAETLAFTQIPAAAPVWLVQEVQASTPAYSANTVPVVLDGESA